MKNEIRRSVRRVLHAMQSEEVVLRSSDLSRIILCNETVKRANVVAIFASLPDEPCTMETIRGLYGRCIVVLPRVCGDIMEFYPYNPQMVETGSYGILEPMNGIPVPADEIDVIIVPGVAFTKNGVRLGRGKGFYDKYMSQEGFRAHKIGVCFSCQLLGELPCDGYDVLMDEVVVL